MIQFDTTDGSIVIDFPANKVRVKSPTFGGLKRLRSERVRLNRAAQDKLAAWDAEHPEPQGAPIDGDDTNREPVDQDVLARYREDRAEVDEASKLDGTAAWWKLILLGDDSFKRLTDDPVPENVDDWPAPLLFDVRPVVPPLAPGERVSTDVILSMQSTPDRVVRHWGEVRRPSGGGAATDPTPSL